MQWVSANRKLIRQIAAPYLRHMAADSNDLFQEASISAFKALIVVQRKEKQQHFVPYFRVIFKTNCIKLASGIETAPVLEDFHLTCEDPAEPEDWNEAKIEAALRAVSERQREICLWLLQQSSPVSTPELAREFKFSRRQACRLVNISIQRIAAAHL